MNDPNWLLSTTVQSSAAIIGLIGAFLINRVFNIPLERRIINEELEKIEKELQELENEQQVSDNDLYKKFQGVKNIATRKALNIGYRDYLLSRINVVPKSLYFGLVVLVVFTILGVLVPFFMIPANSNKLNIIVYICFPTGLVLVIAYFIYAVIEISKKVK